MSRRPLAMRAAALALSSVLIAIAVTPLAARLAIKPIPYKCPPCLAAANEFVRIDVSPAGTWTMGTTGGDPDTPDDDHKLMIYGFIPGGTSDVGSSYTTIRVIGPSGSMDAMPTEAETLSQTVGQAGDRVTTVWEWRQPYRTRVTQTLTLAPNPYSGRPDAAWVRYEMGNRDTVQTRVGLRSMIDVKLGGNDGAPYILPGIGAVSLEHEFLVDEVPPFWLAFESPEYDPRQLRSVGLLRGEGLTSPDRLVIAWWVSLRDKAWEYTVDPAQPITIDSAVALFYEPLPLEPGATRVVTTSYGVAGNRGGEVFLTSPSATCGSEFPISLFVSNFEGAAFTNGKATLVLPPDLSLAAGESVEKSIDRIDPGRTGSVMWRVRAGPAAQGDYPVSAVALFDDQRSFDANLIVAVSCDAPTPTPTASATRTAVPSPTSSPTRTSGPAPTVSPTPDMGPEVCRYLLSRVPPAAIAAAMSQPEQVSGWGDLCQPSRPPSPYNFLRDRLALKNFNAPYHEQFNPLVFKCQCP